MVSDLGGGVVVVDGGPELLDLTVPMCDTVRTTEATKDNQRQPNPYRVRNTKSYEWLIA